MIIFGVVLIGLAFGSFVNALVWRVHEQTLPAKQRAASAKELSVMTGRSMCPHCKHTLAWYDLLPVVSWLSLLGKCRYCHQPISWQYPLVELVTTGLFVLSYIFWPEALTSGTAYLLFGIWLTALVGLVALAIYDIRWMLLPNKMVFPLLATGVVMTLGRMVAADRPVHLALMAIGGLAVAGGIFYVLFQISDGAWIGGGDVKLGFALGLLLGSPVLGFVMLFLASLIGLIVALPGVMLQKSTLSSKVPFGPFLIAATIVTMLFGQSLVDWYSAQYLFF